VTALLLDTGPFAMALTDDPRLPAGVRARLESADRVALSVISFYEIGQKARLGKWPPMAPFVANLVEQARADGCHLIPLSPAAAAAALGMDWDHRDPFDRIIVAAARGEGLPIISPDTAVDAIGAPRI